ncbi:uncharacterized protein [Paramormyrops kingsleyae]|uniref:uncharacterized protein isoform X1 n=1 Tax=Paramormyrops kingsleyae TaxID=1676925 RepID=UPI003B978D18
MSEDILTFQAQLSGIMEMVLKAAVQEITTLVEGSFQGEVVRSRKEVENLKQRLQFSEKRWRDREQRMRAKCAECGGAGLSAEAMGPVLTLTETEEGGIKENNNLGGAWSIAPWTALDVQEAASASPTHSPETTDAEKDVFDVIHKGETQINRKSVEIVEEVSAPCHSKSPTEPDLLKGEKQRDSTGKNTDYLTAKALKAEPKDVYITPYTDLNKPGLGDLLTRTGQLQNRKLSCHIKAEQCTFSADIRTLDNLFHVQRGSSSGPSRGTVNMRDAIKEISYTKTTGSPDVKQYRIQSVDEEDLEMHPSYNHGLWISPEKYTENDLNISIIENQHFCPYCGYTTSNIANLNVHLQSHNAEKLFSSSQLQITSPRGDFRTKLQQDKRQSSAYSRYHGKKFHGGGNLERHVNVHRDDALHSCSECGKTFNRAYNLKIHKRSHTGERPYLCTHCKKGFVSPTDLRRHKRIHTGEKPYACMLCGSKFRQSWSLKMHQRIHTQEKPHCCIQCGKCFRCSGDLSKHMRVHTGEKPYICKSCGKGYSQSQNLKSHRCFIQFQGDGIC